MKYYIELERKLPFGCSIELNVRCRGNKSFLSILKFHHAGLNLLINNNSLTVQEFYFAFNFVSCVPEFSFRAVNSSNRLRLNFWKYFRFYFQQFFHHFYGKANILESIIITKSTNILYFIITQLFFAININT